ncbi:MAG: LacI family DNA-binding transcriptional regulator [Lentisphaerae bacterium]|nr:LacI family DNA-binding transcriptional regulator [Lentisphaerota bacterium]
MGHRSTICRLKDVAEAAGVSIPTVAGILNSGDQRYSAATRSKVREVAEHLGYRPSRMAQTMRSGKSHTVGLICQIWPHQTAADRVVALGHAFSEAGYDLLHIDPSLHAHSLRTACHNMVDARVAGVVVAVMRDDLGEEDMDLFRAARIPVVLLSAQSMRSTPMVCPDVRRGIHDVTRHVIDRGCSHIVYAGSPFVDWQREDRYWSVIQRVLGFCDAIDAAGGSIAGIEAVPKAIRDLYGHSAKQARCHGEVLAATAPSMDDPYESGRSITEQILARKDRPDALVFSNDYMAIGGLGACQRAGLRVPEDIAITGFDNTSLGRAIVPSLTTVAQPTAAMAKAAAELLLARMTHPSLDADDRVIRLPCELVVRESA